jgi:hypothetical protein
LKNRDGEIVICPKYGKITILKYFNSANCTIKFEDGTILKNVQYYRVVTNNVKNPMKPNFFGVGYIGIGKFSMKKESVSRNCINSWTNMLSRAYNKKVLEVRPNYKDVTVCEEWHNFQNFAKWYKNNYNLETMKGWQLDKDILVKGNKIYSPDTCCFVPQEINQIFTLKSKKSECATSVYKQGNRYVACIRKNSIRSTIGTYNSIEEAFQAYRIEKENYIKEIANKWKDKIPYNIYDKMINYEY